MPCCRELMGIAASGRRHLGTNNKAESTMASKQSKELVDLFKRMSGAIAADPRMSMGTCAPCWSMEGMQPGNLAVLTTSRLTQAALRPCGRSRKVVRRIASYCAPTEAVTSPDRCTHLGRCTRITRRKSVAGRSSSTTALRRKTGIRDLSMIWRKLINGCWASE